MRNNSIVQGETEIINDPLWIMISFFYSGPVLLVGSVVTFVSSAKRRNGSRRSVNSKGIKQQVDATAGPARASLSRLCKP